MVDATEEAIADGTATGFLYQELASDGLFRAVERAIQLYRDRPATWQELIQTGMSRDFSWARAAASYLEVYRGAIERRRA